MFHHRQEINLRLTLRRETIMLNTNFRILQIKEHSKLKRAVNQDPKEDMFHLEDKEFVSVEDHQIEKFEFVP